MGRIDLRIEVEREHSLPQDNDQPEKQKEENTTSSQSRLQVHENRNQYIYKDHVTYVYKDYSLYLAAKIELLGFGEILDQISAAEDTPPNEIVRRSVSPAGNTLLHIAANHGNERAAAYIASKDPSLLLIQNFDGETALHLAARAGHESMVTTLLSTVENTAEKNDLLGATNERGNTTLHEALLNGQDHISQYLMYTGPHVPYCDNKEGESVLYLAAKAGSADCVSLVLGLWTGPDNINELCKKKSPIQAAIQRKNRDVLQAMLNRKPSLIQSRDSEGRTPLHYAASLGYLEETHYLLNRHQQSATQRDESGSLPIHLASIKGHLAVVCLFLLHYPDAAELIDRDGRNILHLAAENGRCNIVSYILNTPHLKDLINMKDKRGNVPLHLATVNWHPKIVSALTWDKRVDIKLVNHMGMTALDAAEYNMSDNPQFPQRLTWAALKAAGTPRSLSHKAADTQTEKKSSKMDNYKERVNTLLLVATLVATITFAAGFTMPGGYQDLGTPTMLRHKGFHVFIFCDTIAMYSSIVVAATLIWAQLGDLKLAFNALTLAVPLLGLALCMMSIAFTAGVFLVVSELGWLSTAVLVMGITFLVILLIILLPLCSSLASSNRIVRYLSYYPFHLLVLASSS